MFRTPLTAAACLGGVLLASVPTAAMAETAEFKDVRGEARTGMDLHDVRLTHRDRAVRVTTTHQDLRPGLRAGGSLAIFLDVDATERGPEYAVVAGIVRGSDFSLVETEGWTFGEAVPGAHISLSVDYDKERVRVRIPRAALDHPEKVRIAVAATGERRDGELETDWLRTIRHVTTWVAVG